MELIFISLVPIVLLFILSNSFTSLTRLLVIILLLVTLLSAAWWISSLPFSAKSQYIAVNNETGEVATTFFHLIANLYFFAPLYMYFINCFHALNITKRKFIICISIATVLFAVVNLM